MSTQVLNGKQVVSGRPAGAPFADKSLKAAAGSWLAVAVVGQLVFAFSVASYYGGAVLRGSLEAWNRFITEGYVLGDTFGNLTVAAHLLAAVVVLVGGALQLVPWVRRRAPVFHRWNGRVYMVSAVTIGIAGLYMTWFRQSAGDLSVRLGSTLNVVLIVAFAAMALRAALRRDFASHRRWALRLFLATIAAWVFRLAFTLWLATLGPVGFDPSTFKGPLLTIMNFATYLVPLAVLELYLRAQRGGARGRLAMAAGLAVLTLATAAGTATATMAFFLPRIRAAYDSRKSIAETLTATIASSGVGEAVRQYHALKAEQPETYNFDRGELNTLGYTLLRAKRFEQAIRIFELNVEAYPQWGNAYDSLGEAYLAFGDKLQAIANYQRALELDPSNAAAAQLLQKLR